MAEEEIQRRREEEKRQPQKPLLCDCSVNHSLNLSYLLSHRVTTSIWTILGYCPQKTLERNKPPQRHRDRCVSMHMHVYPCMYTCPHVCTRRYVYRCRHICVSKHVHKCMCTSQVYPLSVSLCMGTHVYVSMDACVCVHMCVPVCMCVHTCVYKCVQLTPREGVPALLLGAGWGCFLATGRGRKKTQQEGSGFRPLRCGFRFTKYTFQTL